MIPWQPLSQGSKQLGQTGRKCSSPPEKQCIIYVNKSSGNSYTKYLNEEEMSNPNNIGKEHERLDNNKLESVEEESDKRH